MRFSVQDSFNYYKPLWLAQEQLKNMNKIRHFVRFSQSYYWSDIEKNVLICGIPLHCMQNKIRSTVKNAIFEEYLSTFIFYQTLLKLLIFYVFNGKTTYFYYFLDADSPNCPYCSTNIKLNQKYQVLSFLSGFRDFSNRTNSKQENIRIPCHPLYTPGTR